MRTAQLLRKIAPPLLPKAALHRLSLLSTLEEVFNTAESGTFRYRLLLLCAPSGYGKTTLLADCVQKISLSSCWYALDQTDSDAVAFLRVLIASLRHRFPDFGPDLDRILQETFSGAIPGPFETVDLEYVLEAIIEAIEHDISEPFALILMNYHEMNHAEQINYLVNWLLAYLPESVIIVLESRSVPSLNLVALLARRKMLGLGSNHFRLSDEEIQALATVQGVTPLTQEEVDYLIRAFDGWIAGILLGTHLGHVQLLRDPSFTGQGDKKQPVAIQRQRLFAHLVDDVFSREPEEYQVLREAAILQQMTPSLCNQLLGRVDTEAHLTYLEENGLFISRYGEGRQAIWVCHAVIRELLCEELQSNNPEHFIFLHRKAALLFEKTQEYDQAIYHALQVDNGLAAQLISEAYWPMLNQGYLEMVEQWIDHIPAHVLSQYPQLLIAYAGIHLSAGRQEQALASLHEAEVLLGQPSAHIKPDEVPFVHYEMNLVHSKSLWLSGQYAQAQRLCQETLALLPIDEVRLRTEAHIRLGMCAIHMSDITAGIQQLQQALQLIGSNTRSRQFARLHSQLANAYHLLSNHGLAEHHRVRATRCWEQLSDQQGKIKNMIEVGIVLQRRGFFTEAEATLKQAFKSAKEASFDQGMAYALVSLGDLYQDQGRYDEALTVTEDGLAQARQLHDFYLTVYSLCSLATLYLHMGDAATAEMLISRVDLSEALLHCDWTERIVYDVTRGTILLQQQHYAPAMALLREMEATTAKIGLKREHLQCLLRLAACAQAQQETTQMRSMLEIVVHEAIQFNYELLIQTELRNLPALEQAMRALPETAFLQAALAQTWASEAEKNRGVEIRPEARISPILSTPSIAIAPGAASLIQIRGFGEPTVLVDHQPITRWRIARAMELFFFLLDCRKPVYKEQIITALWAESDENEQIDQKFRTTIYYLRKALGESCVVSHHKHYSLHLQAVYAQVDNDVATFQDLVTLARQALENHDEESACQNMRQIVKLYQGDYLQSFYGDWCNARRDELRRSYIDACRQLASIALRQERWDESITYWQHLLAIDKCMEEAHCGVMSCYIQQGKRELAMRQYRRCVITLRDEMALTPGTATQQLYQRLAGVN